MARAQYYRVKCGYEACQEYAHYEKLDRKHGIELDLRYGNGRWRCVRHSNIEEVLSHDNVVRTIELVCEQREHGRYFGHFGFVSGPGFKAFAADFPAGTRLCVTAEVILPTASEGVTP